MSRQRHPKINGTLNLSDLSKPVEIIRDRWGIPHIYAKTENDLFFAQGFVHAQDRMWQMELNRRTAQGRLSELFGELAFDTDRTARTFGFHRLGSEDWENSSDQLRAIFQAYTNGVNAFLDHPECKLPLEFTLLRHRPEPWRPEDSASFGRVMIWQLSHAWNGEIVRAQLIQDIGPEAAAELEIHYPEINPVALPTGLDFNEFDPQGNLRRAKGPFLERSMGSNAWAVSGSKTTTGGAFLCNDMHLPLSIPSLWYEVHLIGAGFNVTGVSLPGIPLVLVGHNTHIGWGMTLAFTDCEDLFIERMSPQNPRHYLFEEKWLEAEVIEEEIHVKGREDPHKELVFVTHHGPIISDVVEGTHHRLAIQSMALRPSEAFRGWLTLNQARDWDSFVAAMHLIDAPQLSVVYADVEGNIGYWVTGKVPVRAKGEGVVPSPGWTGEYEWRSEIPFEEMPHALNPERGHLITCNNRVVSNEYPHFLGHVWMNGYRANRVEQLFEKTAKLSSDDFEDMQLDTFCIPGLELVKLIGEYQNEDPLIQAAIEKLQAWDGYLTVDSIGGTIYEVLRYTLVRNLLAGGVEDDLAFKLMGKGFHPLLYPSNEFFGHDTVTMLRILKDSHSWWVGQAGGRDKLISESMVEAIAWLSDHLGRDVDDWQWGKLHQLTLEHPLSLQKPLDRVFNRGPSPIGGDTDTVCQTAMRPDDPYDLKAWAPSYRQILDFSDLSRSVAMYPPGQSGHLGSPHYDDLIQPWLKGEYHPMLWTREQVIEHAEGRLVLKSSG
jgi:penicillin amidase